MDIRIIFSKIKGGGGNKDINLCLWNVTGIPVCDHNFFFTYTFCSVFFIFFFKLKRTKKQDFFTCNSMNVPCDRRKNTKWCIIPLFLSYKVFIYLFIIVFPSRGGVKFSDSSFSLSLFCHLVMTLLTSTAAKLYCIYTVVTLLGNKNVILISGKSFNEHLFHVSNTCCVCTVGYKIINLICNI